MFTPHEPPMSLKAALARAYGSPAFCQSGRPTAVDATLAPFAASRFGSNGRPRAYPPPAQGLRPWAGGGSHSIFFRNSASMIFSERLPRTAFSSLLLSSSVTPAKASLASDMPVRRMVYVCAGGQLRSRMCT